MRRLGLTLVLSLLVVGIGFVLVLIGMTIHFAREGLEPPRVTIEPLADARFQDITFTTEDNITLSGWYCPPTNGMVIILLHGYAGSRMQMVPEARLLADHGYGVLLFDFRGHGMSGDALVTGGDHERRDLRAALDFVDGQPDVDRIGAIGFSMGAATLVQVAAEDDRLQAVIVEAAFTDLETTLQYRSRVFGPISQIPTLWVVRSRGVDVDDVRPVDDICRISPRPVLLIYGDQDADVPPGSAQTMFKAACDPVDLWIIQGAHHGDTMTVSPEAYSARLLDFFDSLAF